ncbi:DMT family transporter [Tropicibacter alexandrii]|uniref:DMT family transporter n=1 Tax=Tropicibacter alexandrii TaxID=2267683 RepID=UPI000EF4F02A|nr:DMT family transporter [Tropicibacter alexandrii]
MSRVLPFLALIVIGAAWGATQPLSKIAVSTGYRHFGLIFWQTALMTVLLYGITALRGRRVPWTRKVLPLYLFIAVIGTVLPGITSYSAIAHLPSGVMSILLSSVPMFALPVALAMGNDSFRLSRLGGLVLGFGGVALLALPEASLPDGTEAIWVAIALLSSLCYAFEGNGVARWGTQGLGPFTVLAGASAVAAVISLPLALATGQFIVPTLPLGGPELALLGSVVLHALAYSGYVWLVGQAGSVFAAQVSYLVTLFGVTWAMLFLGEGYSGWIWAAMGLMLGGIALVQPRPKSLVPAPVTSEDAQA